MDESTTLLATRSAILADLLALADPANRKPNYSIDGQSVSWSDYRTARLEDLKLINELLVQVLPFEFRSSVA